MAFQPRPREYPTDALRDASDPLWTLYHRLGAIESRFGETSKAEYAMHELRTYLLRLAQKSGDKTDWNWIRADIRALDKVNLKDALRRPRKDHPDYELWPELEETIRRDLISCTAPHRDYVASPEAVPQYDYRQ